MWARQAGLWRPTAALSAAAVAESIPTWVANGTAYNSQSGGTINLPSHQAGDILVIFGATANQSFTVDGSWAQITNSPKGTGTAGAASAHRITIWWLRAADGSTAEPTLTDGGDHHLGVCAAFRGCLASGDPFSGTSNGAAESSSTTATFTSITTTHTNCLVVNAIATDRDSDQPTGALSNWTAAGLSDYTERFDLGVATGQGSLLGFACGGLAVAGGTGANTVTQANNGYSHLTFALRPAAV
jgi:hypothetical protein